LSRSINAHFNHKPPITKINTVPPSIPAPIFLSYRIIVTIEAINIAAAIIIRHIGGLRNGSIRTSSSYLLFGKIFQPILSGGI